MKEVRISEGPKATFHDVPVPEPKEDQVVIKVVVSGSNPKDWKMTKFIPGYNENSGDDIAGIVHSVGSKVWEFKPGDRVASFHEMLSPHGSFAEYAVGWSWTTFHIPSNVSFEEAATIPLAAMTAAIGLHLRLGLPDPWTPATEPTPLLIYGGATAVGAYAIQLACLANIHPIIAVTGRGETLVESLIDRAKGDTIVDYRKGDDAVVEGVKAALNGASLHYAYDAVADHNSYTNSLKVLEPQGRFTIVLPDKVPEAPNRTLTTVGDAHKDAKDFAYLYFRYFARGLAEGWFKPHPHEVVPGGLNGVETALRNLYEGKASAIKYVFRIEETNGVKEN